MVEQKFESWEDMWENEAIEKGMAKGLAQARQEGLQQGLQQGALTAMRSLLVRRLSKRFGDLPSAVLMQIDAAGLGGIEKWLERSYEATSVQELFMQER